MYHKVYWWLCEKWCGTDCKTIEKSTAVEIKVYIFLVYKRSKIKTNMKYFRFIAQVQLKTEEGAMKQIPQSHVPVKTEENATLKQEFKQEFKTEFK